MVNAFLRGIARLLDFNRTLSDYDFLKRTDADALRADWQAVSNDMRRAMQVYEKERKR